MQVRVYLKDRSEQKNGEGTCKSYMNLATGGSKYQTYRVLDTQSVEQSGKCFLLFYKLWSHCNYVTLTWERIPGSPCVYMYIHVSTFWKPGERGLCSTTFHSPCLELCISQCLTTPICIHCLCMAYSMHAYTSHTWEVPHFLLHIPINITHAPLP